MFDDKITLEVQQEHAGLIVGLMAEKVRYLTRIVEMTEDQNAALCREITELKDAVKELQAENAELRTKEVCVDE